MAHRDEGRGAERGVDTPPDTMHREISSEHQRLIAEPRVLTYPWGSLAVPPQTTTAVRPSRLDSGRARETGGAARHNRLLLLFCVTVLFGGIRYVPEYQIVHFKFLPIGVRGQ